MSLLNDTKTVGLLLFVVGIVQIIGALLSIIDGAGADVGTLAKVGLVIVGIGMLIAAVIFFKFGNSVRKGEYSDKLKLVAGFVKIVGYTMMISGFFALIGYALAGNWSGVGSGLGGIILGFIIRWIGGKVDDGKNTGFDKILWLVLVLVFLIFFITKIVGAFGSDILGLIGGICSGLSYLILLVFMFDKDVKDGML